METGNLELRLSLPFGRTYLEYLLVSHSRHKGAGLEVEQPVRIWMLAWWPWLSQLSHCDGPSLPFCLALGHCTACAAWHLALFTFISPEITPYQVTEAFLIPSPSCAAWSTVDSAGLSCLGI